MLSLVMAVLAADGVLRPTRGAAQCHTVQNAVLGAGTNIGAAAAASNASECCNQCRG